MSLRTCAACSTQYAVDIDACPHCGSTSTTDDGTVTRRLSLFVSVSCPVCDAAPRTIRLESVTSGLVVVPALACTSCGGRVPVIWPPEEEPVSPKITVHGGASNARGADVSPAADVSQPLTGVDTGQGHSTENAPADTAPQTIVEGSAEDPAGKNYDAMSLGELREEATRRGVPSYGTKAQIAERLHDADTAPTEPSASSETQE